MEGLREVLAAETAGSGGGWLGGFFSFFSFGTSQRITRDGLLVASIETPGYTADPVAQWGSGIGLGSLVAMAYISYLASKFYQRQTPMEKAVQKQV